ncbi:MAG: hypothetical protein KTR27_20885 [Leptolyngbyaceae cyanobacterium MAG.088]|nr:hypothetical protein [Leptolyngbyaceae cyanobacterium MAG.088]
MQGWGIGIVFLYIALGIFNWVTGLHWLAEFSLPMSLVAGLGLAIASLSPVALPSASTHASDDIATASDSDLPATDLDATPSQSSTQPSQQITEPSISFTIDKNVRP